MFTLLTNITILSMILCPNPIHSYWTCKSLETGHNYGFIVQKGYAISYNSQRLFPQEKQGYQPLQQMPQNGIYSMFKCQSP